MTSQGSIDCASSYFKCKTPTPMQWVPTNKSIKWFKTEFQANAIFIETDLGGGDHGHLGLTLTDAECAELTGTDPFVVPNYFMWSNMPTDASLSHTTQLKEENVSNQF